MGARPARKIYGTDGNGGFRFDEHSQWTEDFRSLKRTDLLAAVKFTGGGSGASGTTNDELRAVIAERHGLTVTAPFRGGESVTRVGAARSVTVKDAPDVPSGGDGSALALAIREIVGSPAIDMDTVNAAIDERLAGSDVMLDRFQRYVDTAIAEIARPTTLVINDIETGTIPALAHRVVPEVIGAMRHGFPVMLCGPAGTGKSFIGDTVGEALGLPVYALSVGPADTRSVLFGYMDAHGKYVSSVVRDAYETGGVLIIDEIDNGNPSVLSTLNMLLSGSRCQFPDGMIAKHPDCLVMATANTYGLGADRQYVGRNVLDAATLDRFTVKIDVDYDARVEDALVAPYGAVGASWAAEVRHYRTAAAAHGMPLIFSMRVMVSGAALLADGWTRQRVRDVTVFAGKNVEAINTLSAGLTVTEGK